MASLKLPTKRIYTQSLCFSLFEIMPHLKRKKPRKRGPAGLGLRAASVLPLATLVISR